jgi:hypothetical protein
MVLFPHAMKDALEHLIPMMERVRRNTGGSPKRLIADA